MIIPLGIRYNNPWDLQGIHLQYLGEVPVDGSEKRFDTLADGIRAGVKLCYKYQERGWNTPQAFINHYTNPATDHPEQYLTNVCNWSGLTPSTLIDFHADANMVMWARAIFRQELGPIAERGITDGQIYAGIALANGED